MHAYIQHTFALARVLAHILDVQDQGFLLVSKLDTSDEKSTTKQNQRLNKTYFFLNISMRVCGSLTAIICMVCD
jgi:hypothetical protein